MEIFDSNQVAFPAIRFEINFTKENGDRPSQNREFLLNNLHWL